MNNNITFISGPMFSGKSTALLQRMEKYLYAKKKILLIRPEKDNRGYFTHSENSLEKLKQKGLSILEVKRIDESFIKSLEKENYKAIFIDEYFMIPGAYLFCNNFTSDIYFAGLLASSEGTVFEEAKKILPFCNSIKFMQAVCVYCGEEANMSLYVGETKKKQSVVVDTNNDLYKPVCRKCWFTLKKSKT